MNKLKSIITLLLLLIAFGTFAQDLPEQPNPPRLVNDFTNTLTSEQKANLEQKLVAFNDSSSTQIAVVIIPSLNGYDISDYAFKLGDKWGIGQKDKRNGVLLLTSMEDRKVFIAVGYGLEGVIPDAYAKRITSTIIKPAYQAGNYYQGIDDGTNALIKLSTGEYKADPKAKGKGVGVFPIFLLIFLVFIIISFISRRRQYQHIAGKGAGSDLPFWMLMTMMGNNDRRHGGGWDDFSGGGGSGGGGFGGFGGGSFGGGGAGDSW